VNLVAKLEKHSKLERFRALCTAKAYETARRQGYQPETAPAPLGPREVAGVEGLLELVGLSRLA
jgi:hypothetical protein